MKKIFWILCLVCAACVRAQSVSESEVRAYAGVWLRENPLVIRYQQEHVLPLEIDGIELLELVESYIPFYLIHLRPQGYIIMNSDRRLKPVLCFSISGDINLEDREDNAFYQLLLIQSEKNTRQISSTLSNAPAFPQWNVGSEFRLMSNMIGGEPGEDDIIGPLLSTLWDQSNHYNEYCPLDPNASEACDGRVPVGCVATAFAQVMNYHEWPYRGTGSKVHEDTEGSITGTHTAEFSDPYEWWHMQDEYYVWGIEPEEAVNAVSELMYELGVAGKMNYENGLSSASSEEMGIAIEKHFFYESVTRTESSDFDRLMNSVLDDLVDRRPCVASIPGHALVIDGHMKQGGDDYFHVNYGFSGLNDGWYMLDNIREDAVTDAFTGIRPALTAFHLGSQYTLNGVELQWLLPKTRSEEVTRIDVLRQGMLSGTWEDPAEQLGTFKVTSTSDYKDWTVSSAGYAGNCYYKPAGGYANMEYHLTSTVSFRPGQETRLIFQARYILGEDVFSVLISSDNGRSFFPVWSVSNSFQENFDEIQIPLEVYSRRDILIRFEYSAGNYYSDGGVWLDDIRLVSTQWYDWSVIHQIDELTAYRAEFETSFSDEAEDFSTFEITSSSDYEDWSLSSTGNTGNCFYKPAGGYSNREYHLTSTDSFQPGSETVLTFMAKYFLSGDAFSVLVSSDNASSFSPVWSVSNALRERWTEIRIPLGDYLGQDIRIRFDYQGGDYYPDGGVWIDDVRLVEVTGAEYLKHPVYYSLLTGLADGINVLAYQVRTEEQTHPRSEPFVIDVPW